MTNAANMAFAIQKYSTSIIVITSTPNMSTDDT